MARGIHEKLVRRHPHVFEGASSEMGDITRRWEDIKQEERGGAGVMDTIPATLPAVLYAAKVLRKAASAGHPWSPEPTDELGDRLLGLVAEALERGIDPEAALWRSAAPGAGPGGRRPALNRSARRVAAVVTSTPPSTGVTSAP